MPELDSDDRDESPSERLDRQFDDLLQELRVSQAGVQILFAFLLGIAFTDRFAELAQWQHDLYIATLLCTVTATVMFIGPVSYARIVFRHKMREKLVQSGSRMALCGLVFLMLAVVGAVLLVTSLVLGIAWALTIGAVVLVVFLLVWYALPITARRRVGTRGPT